MNGQAIVKTVAALAAAGYLVLMVWTGALPSHELVKFEEKGVMAEDPAAVTVLTITAGTKHAALERRAGGWAKAGQPDLLPGELAASLEKAVKFAHTANPVRELAAAEVQGADPHEFGLAPPRATIALKGARGTLVTLEFGGRNTDGILQYLRVQGRPGLYLMSGFVGEEWERVFKGVLE